MRFIVTGDDYDRVAKWIAARYPEVEVLDYYTGSGSAAGTYTLVTCFDTRNDFWTGAEKIIEPDRFWGVLLPITGDAAVDEPAWVLRLDPLVRTAVARAEQKEGEAP